MYTCSIYLQFHWIRCTQVETRARTHMHRGTTYIVAIIRRCAYYTYIMMSAIGNEIYVLKLNVSSSWKENSKWIQKYMEELFCVHILFWNELQKQQQQQQQSPHIVHNHPKNIGSNQILHSPSQIKRHKHTAVHRETNRQMPSNTYNVNRMHIVAAYTDEIYAVLRMEMCSKAGTHISAILFSLCWFFFVGSSERRAVNEFHFDFWEFI